jgi:Ni,Fe-hydrogenase III large subunit/Ni,Fe-hydrogenase III component G
MRLTFIDIELDELAGAVTAWRGEIDAAGWRDACVKAASEGGRLVALWGSDLGTGRTLRFAVHAALVVQSGLVVLTCGVTDEFPDLSDIFPAANRMQRAVADLLGIRACAPADARKWLRHAAWNAGEFPLRKDFPIEGRGHGNQGGYDDAYPFVPVAGDAVHEIAVGPVHAGTIEPGHFRFSVVGERVLRLEERLGYKHKGVEKQFERLDVTQGAKLAGRISCDSTVAYAWAYAMAVEAVAGVTPPARALTLRAVCLELERIANHLGDLGFLGNDAGLAFGLAQFLRLKEELLRTHVGLFGHRYLMDVVIPGGIARDLPATGIAALREACDAVESEVKTLRSIYEDHPGLQDRFINCGRVMPHLAAQLGLTGVAGRASAQAWDLRAQFPCAPYDSLDVQMATHRNGDVAARASVRFDEVIESVRLVRLLLELMPLGAVSAQIPVAREGAIGCGWVEGWRGEVFIYLEAGPRGSIARLHPHDPSWQAWPVLEHAVLGNIVPDFPLINKSFNLSYSGHDL